jgi:amidase
MDLGYFEIDPVMRRNTLAALDIFRRLGCEVREVDVGWDLSALDVFTTHWEAMMAASFADMLPRWRYEFDPWVSGLIERGTRHSAARHYRLKRVRAEMYAKIAPILETHEVLLCPTTAIAAVAPDHDHENPDFRINGEIVSPAIQMYLTYPFNLLGRLPAASVPSGYCPETGIPTGLQIVARSYGDLRVFRAAAAYEAANPWRGKRPKL